MPEPGAGPGPDPGRLDGPPKQQPGTPKKADRASLVQNQMLQQKSAGLGGDAGIPQVRIMQSLGTILKEFQTLGMLLPAMAPAFNQLSQNLQQAIPQGMADQLAGNDQTGAAVPPSGAPMPPPPGPPPLPGGAPSMAGAPVMGATPAGLPPGP